VVGVKTVAKETNKSMNEGLGAAKSAKKDEFYTQYIDIQKEIEAYLEFDPNTFRGKIIYCNCDDPFESNFFKYFAANFNRLGLKKLISTSRDGSPIAGEQLRFENSGSVQATQRSTEANAIEIEEVTDLNDDGATDIEDVRLFLEQNPHKRAKLKGGGDFRSPECVEFLKQADIVVTNPPFSLFREYVAQLIEHKKSFLVIGNTNAITYKEVFPHIKANKLWLGCTNFNVGMFFEVPADWERFHHVDNQTGKKIARVSTSCWYTNLDHGRRHKPLNLMTMADNLRFSASLRDQGAYENYDNYDAIEVGTYKEIPSDYDGVMGVPVTFLDKYSPDQFEIVGYEKSYNLQCKTYGMQIQVDKSGKRSNVMKLNDGAVIKVDNPPNDATYYIVDGGYYVQRYKRIFIRRRAGNGEQGVTNAN
jgi:hypothetical protein